MARRFSCQQPGDSDRRKHDWQTAGTWRFILALSTIVKRRVNRRVSWRVFTGTGRRREQVCAKGHVNQKSVFVHVLSIPNIPSEPMENLLEILTEIKKQNLEILSRLTPKASRKYLSVDEAAERLDRSPWTVRQLCNAGQIVAVKGDDKTWRISADEVARLEENGVPRLPSRTVAPSRPLSLRGRGAGSVASCSQSHAPSICL